MIMLTPQEKIARLEKALLAPYAAFSSESRGRQHSMKEHPLRTAYQRDRDRIIHSAAFRRMEYKTQVFVNSEGDYYRTRLTHSIEVAQISRTIARALGLNEDLTEAIALVHDLGHTPFGHSGEIVLDKLMTDFGGFNHNHQSLHVVDQLEWKYPDYPGLNLTYEVREGIVKHESGTEPISSDIFPPGEKPTLEASLVDLADAIAYNTHDLDDGLASGILDWKQLDAVPVWVEIKKRSKEIYPELTGKLRRHSVVRILVDYQVTDLINRTYENIKKYNIQTLADVRNSSNRLIAFSENKQQELGELKTFLLENMYRHPRMKAMADQAEVIIKTLFDRYKKEPQKLHGKFKLRLEKEPVELIIRDFIAGMTDRYAMKLYEELK